MIFEWGIELSGSGMCWSTSKCASSFWNVTIFLALAGWSNTMPFSFWNVTISKWHDRFYITTHLLINDHNGEILFQNAVLGFCGTHNVLERVGIDLSRNILSSYLVLKYTKNIHRFEIEVLQWKGPQGCLCVGCTFAKLSSKLLSLRVLGGVRAYWPPLGAFGTCGSGGRQPTHRARLDGRGPKIGAQTEPNKCTCY